MSTWVPWHGPHSTVLESDGREHSTALMDAARPLPGGRRRPKCRDFWRIRFECRAFGRAAAVVRDSPTLSDNCSRQFSLVLPLRILYNADPPALGQCRHSKQLNPKGGTVAVSSSAIAMLPLLQTQPRRSLEQMLGDRWELIDAWRRVKAGGAQAGPDGVTLQAFERDLERNVSSLAVAVTSGRYRPGRLGRQFLRKRDGGTRIIGIPCVADRVLQAAASRWLNELIEPLLLPSSFAYRPSLGPQRAAAYCAKLAAQHAWVVTADIAKYFDNVDHEVLMRLLQALHVSVRDREILLDWLRATPVDRKTPLMTVKGLPQGLTIAPPLANLYLHGFDCELRDAGWAHCRFADDFVVFADSQQDAAVRHAWMADYLQRERRLVFKAAKTAIEPTSRGFDFVGFRIDQECLRLPNDAQDRFKASLDERLQGLAARTDATVRSVNDLVRGWRAYYAGMSDILTRQLDVLEGWRRVRVAAAISRAGLPQLSNANRFDSLTATEDGALPGAYGPPTDDTVAADATAVSPPDVAEPRRVPAVKRGAVVSRVSPRSVGTVRALAIGISQRPWLTVTGDVVVAMHGAFITKSGATLVVKRKKETVFEVPLEAVKHVSVVGAGASVTSSAIAACTSRGIRIWVSDAVGRSLGSFVPVRGAPSSLVVRRLLGAARTSKGTALARSILLGKIQNQRALLLYHSKRVTRSAGERQYLRETAARLRAALPDVRAIQGPMRDTRTTFLLTEARAAAAYWSAWRRLVPESVGFSGRRARGAVDAVNSLLNYGYFRLLHLVWQAVDRVGLIPWHGILHTGRRRAPALVLDLMEEFRVAAVDRVVLGLLGRRFVPRLRPNGRLTLRTQTMFERAWTRNLVRPLGGQPLERTVRQQVAAFRRALETDAAYVPVVMRW